MIERARPDAEFLHVVAHGRHLFGMGRGGFLEISNDLLDGSERNQVAKNFLPGNQANSLSMIFRDVVGKKLVGLESRGKKMNVIQNGVVDITFSQNRGELRLPNALRQPRSRGALAEMVLNIIGKTDKLHTLVRGRNRN